MEANDLAVYIGAAGAIFGSVWAIFKVVAKLTPTTKDDEIAKQFDPIVRDITSKDD